MQDYRTVDKTRAYEAVVAQVERSISERRYRAGTRLPSERHLAEVFGVSRVVIREAMRTLENRGYVAVRQGSGSYVINSDPNALTESVTLLLELEEASLVDLYTVRQSLELTAARLAASSATVGDFEVLEKHLEDMRAIAEGGMNTLEEYMVFARGDEAFHLAIATSSRNPPLTRLLGAILPLFTKGREAILERNRTFTRFLTPAQLALVNEEHANLALAIKNGDAPAAEYFMQWHMQRSIAAWTKSEPTSQARDATDDHTGSR